MTYTEACSSRKSQTGKKNKNKKRMNDWRSFAQHPARQKKAVFWETKATMSQKGRNIF